MRFGAILSAFTILAIVGFAAFAISSQGYPRPDRPALPPTTCCTEGIHGVEGSECFLTPSIDACRDLGGAVEECGRFYGLATNDTNYKRVNVTQLVPNSSINIETDPPFASLTEAIRRAGVYNNHYNQSSYNCANFSDDLERNLTAAGFNATVTILGWGHAITDVHIGPYTIWVEPQINASRRRNQNDTFYTYLIPYATLDYEGRNDSRIDVLIAPNPYPNTTLRTEDGVMIAVYDNMSQARAAGVRQGR